MGLLDKFHSFTHSPIHNVLTGGLHGIAQGIIDKGPGPLEQSYAAGKKARKLRGALSAQEEADLQAERDQKTEEELLANNQRVASKRSYVANSLALGGPPIMAGANVLASGAGSGPVTSSSPGGYGGGYSQPPVLAQGGALGGVGANIPGTPFRAKRPIVPGVMSRG